MSAGLRRIADRALTAGAVLGVLALVGTALGITLGVRPMFFRSGSMAPAIDTGAIAFAREVPARDLRVGDIVSVTTAAGVRVTHRVVGTERSDDRVVLTLRGDANRAADRETYPVESAYRVFWHVPRLGYVVAELRGALALALGVGVAGLLLLGLRGRPQRRDVDRPGRHVYPRSTGHRARRAGATAMTAVAVAAGPSAPASAVGWTDGVPAGGAVMNAFALATPTLNCGALGLVSVTFTWPAVAGATRYTLHYAGGTSSVDIAAPTTTKTILGVLDLSGTAWLVAHSDYPSATWDSSASNTRSYTFLAVSVCG
jgi:signal peptidase I